MSITEVRCKNCGGETFKGWEQYNYSLKAHKTGTPVKCSKCKNTTYPTGRNFEWIFCSKKCLKEFLNKTEENYKHEWEN